MPNQQLLDFIKQQLQQGTGKEQIKSSLAANGWKPQDIDEAFSFLANPANQSSPAPSAQIASLPGAAAILAEAWAIYKQRLGTFLGVMIIPTLVTIVFTVAFAGGGLLSFSLFSSTFTLGRIALFFLLLILIYVVIFITQIWGQTALLYAVKDSHEKIGVVESYRRGWHKIFSYWWIGLLSALIILGGFFLLFVPGIIFAIWFSTAAFVLIAEDLRGMNALLKSKEYVKGNWDGVFWRFFFMAIIGLLLYLVPFFVFASLDIPLASAISRWVVGLFLTPLAMTYSFLVYSHLRALKGDVPFAPTKGTKTAFISVAIFGIICMLLIPLFFASTAFRY